jgi:hypothetical protein
MNPSFSRAPFSITWLGLFIGPAASFFPMLAQTAETPKRNLLFIGQAKGYQHEATSTAMAGCFITASATFQPFGNVLTFRKCGLRWCSGRWA